MLHPSECCLAHFELSLSRSLCPTLPLSIPLSLSPSLSFFSPSLSLSLSLPLSSLLSSLFSLSLISRSLCLPLSLSHSHTYPWAIRGPGGAASDAAVPDDVVIPVQEADIKTGWPEIEHDMAPSAVVPAAIRCLGKQIKKFNEMLKCLKSAKQLTSLQVKPHDCRACLLLCISHSSPMPLLWWCNYIPQYVD